MQPNTYGIFGGGILFRDLVNFGIKSHEELLQTPEAFKIHATKELEEESGFSGSIKLENLFIYKDDVCDFHYYNFLGIVREEFNPQAQKDSEWETTGKDRWVTYNELIELEPKHFGLTALIKNAGEKLKAISEKVSEPILSDEEINKNYLKQLNSQY
jgi:8-oxo-dGTP pyrophosphatase MutT (NUDIX family)